MQMTEILTVASQFVLDGGIISITPFGGGHINDTFMVETDSEISYILQKINKNVFRQPLHVIENIEKLLDHFACKDQNSLKTFPSRDGKKYVVDANQDIWRMYNYVEGTQTFDVIQHKSQAYEAAKAFGNFQLQTLELHASDFCETIPDFHHLGKRYNKFDVVLQNNLKNRNELALKEIQFVKERRNISDKISEFIASGKLPMRITHNDAKLNNVLLNKETGKGVCVIDLDTVMPGLVLYDYGDMVRSFTSPVAEDDKDISRVHLRLDIFEELTKGYLSQLSAVLTQTEKENLLLGAKYMTLIMGLRFLTDYIEGDVYYKTGYDDHNLVRAKNQFALYASLEERENELQKIIKSNI
jgi:Ser/Thr protein kinase RdoA (MazF antagonist)